MQLRRTALLFLAACAPADSRERCPGAPTDACAEAPVLAARIDPTAADSLTASPVPSASLSAPVPSTISPVPPASPPTPPRLLHPSIYSFAELADGDLLIDPHDDDLQRLDPGTGALTPWPLTWRPELAGWKLLRDTEASVYAPVVSPDGRWVALQVGFERRAPRTEHAELVAVVLTRGDGSDPRCLGLGVPSDDLPPLGWSADSRRLVGDWSVECSPDARGRARAIADPGELDPYPRPMRWFDVGDGARGEQPLDSADFHYHRDPLGDLELAQAPVDGEDSYRWFFYDFTSGARLGPVALPADEQMDPLGWVAADALLVDVPHRSQRTGQRLLTTDGRSLQAPHMGWRVYTRLPNGELLFSRDDGRTVEQGVVDWQRFAVERSRARPDLVRFAAPDVYEPIWRPGLGGVLIFLDDRGELYLAGI